MCDGIFLQVGRIKQKRGYKDQWPWNIKIYTDEMGNNKGDACLAYEDPSAAHSAGGFYNCIYWALSVGLWYIWSYLYNDYLLLSYRLWPQRLYYQCCDGREVGTKGSTCLWVWVSIIWAFSMYLLKFSYFSRVLSSRLQYSVACLRVLSISLFILPFFYY